MKTASRLLTLLLALALVFTLLPNLARAEEAAPEEDPTFVEVPFQVNPLYSNLYTADDFDVPDVEIDPEAIEPMATTYLTVEKAGEQVRKNMKDRKESFNVSVKASTSNLQTVCDEVVAVALTHTGKATEGDYLMWQYGGWKASARKTFNSTTSLYEYDVTFTVTYYTTADQEKEMNTAVTNLINSLGVRYKSDYEKICAVYDYICENITYDYTTNEENPMLKHTAYAALVNKTAVCQGYATLFYRLMLELGVDNRLIAGMAASGEAHGWNIVQLGDYYYSVDATWDAGVEEYSYFLTNTWNFLGHYRYLDYESWEFHDEFPMAAEDYDPDVTAEIDPYIYVGLGGEEIYWILYRDRSMEFVGTGFMYDYWGTSSSDWGYWDDQVKSVTIGEGIVDVGKSCFHGMPSLTSVSFPSTLTAIWDQAFRDATALEEVVFPDGLQTIGSSAFANCVSLTEVTIPESVVNVTGFSGCASLTTAYVYSSGRIESYAFYDCDALVNLVIGENITGIAGSAFQYCDGLKEVTIPSRIYTANGFCYCDGLETVRLYNPGPIADYAFTDAINLKVIEITAATAIGHMAFYNAAVETITIPDTVKELEYACLGSCDELTEIIFRGDAPKFNYAAFEKTVATAYYPVNNPTWTADVMQNYGGTITWEPYGMDCVDHEYKNFVTDPTCDEQGYTTYTCIHCGYRYLDNYVDALGHDLVSTVYEPTCSRRGYTLHKCTVCGYAYSDSFVDTIPHSYEETVTPPTCRRAGYTTYRCTACGHNYKDDYVKKLPHSYESVVTDPTCTEQGYTTYTCTACGDSYVDDYTGPVDHAYVENVCKWCGDVVYTVEWATVNTTLTGSIDLNYYAVLSNTLVDEPSTFVRFTCAGKTVDVPLSEATTSVKDGVTRYRFSCKVYAKQMTDTVTAQVMTANGAVGEAKSYSVAQYCNALMGATTNEKTIALCKAMLNYGAAAQNLFGYNLDNMANATLSEEDRVVPEFDSSSYAYSIVGAEEGIKATGAKLKLDEDVAIQVTFKLTGDKTIDQYTFTINGEEVEPVASGDRYYIELDGIAASKFGEAYVFSVGGLTVNYSVLSYAYMVHNSASSSDALIGLVNAMYTYHTATAAYVN